MAAIRTFSSPPTPVHFHKSRPILCPITKVSMLNHHNQVPLKNKKPSLLQVRSFNNEQIICKSSQNHNNTTEMEKMEFGVRVATHSILKEFNNGCQDNVVFSPLSLHLAFNLLTAGAKGQTLDQLLRFLGSENITQLNAQSSHFMDLATSKHYSLNQSSSRGPVSRPNRKPFNSRGREPVISLVNGLWVDQPFSLKHSFKQLAEDVFKAKSQSVDFKQAEKVANDINIWAKEASKGHIEDIVSSNSLAGAILVLASALYFKGSWLHPFDASNTEDEDFHLLNGNRVRVPFMKQWATQNFYGSFDGFKLLKMEYKMGQDRKSYAMHIFLPDKYDGIQELIQKFNSDPKFFTDDHELGYVEVDELWLPKLKYDYQLDMTANIKELGLDLPFQRNAELTEIVDQSNVYVTQVIQKSYIEVNEEGTVATSITAFGCGSSLHATEPPPVLNFVVDHPFLFMVKEENSGIVLFVGAALNPLS